MKGTKTMAYINAHGMTVTVDHTSYGIGIYDKDGKFWSYITLEVEGFHIINN
jgi:hypothetical protein